MKPRRHSSRFDFTTEDVISGTAPTVTGSIADEYHSRAWAVADKFDKVALHLLAGVVISKQQVFSAIFQLNGDKRLA